MRECIMCGKEAPTPIGHVGHYPVCSFVCLDKWDSIPYLQKIEHIYNVHGVHMCPVSFKEESCASA